MTALFVTQQNGLAGTDSPAGAKALLGITGADVATPASGGKAAGTLTGLLPSLVDTSSTTQAKAGQLQLGSLVVGTSGAGSFNAQFYGSAGITGPTTVTSGGYTLNLAGADSANRYAALAITTASGSHQIINTSMAAANTPNLDTGGVGAGLHFTVSNSLRYYLGRGAEDTARWYNPTNTTAGTVVAKIDVNGLFTAAGLISQSYLQLASLTVATLPSTASVGQLRHCSNFRAMVVSGAGIWSQEGSNAGKGGPVVCRTANTWEAVGQYGMALTAT